MEMDERYLHQLRQAVDQIKAHSDKFDWVGIYWLNQEGELELGPYVGAKTEHERIQIGQGVCGTAIQEGRDLNIADVSQVENYLACSIDTRSELVVLIRDSSGKILGQIDIDSHTPNAFGAAEESYVKAIGRELGNSWLL